MADTPIAAPAPRASFTGIRQVVQQHYETVPGDQTLLARVTALLEPLQQQYAGGPIPISALSGFDQLHTRGHAPTVELAELAELTAGLKVLDAGCGMGGSARFLAQTYGCDVTGVDLTPAFIDIANLLAQRTGLAHTAHFQVGNLTHLPFAGATFDRIWTQHVVMNIPGRVPLYTELRRVLKAGGKFAFYDILAADTSVEVLYPTPWAKTRESSFLETEQNTRAALEQCGFTVLAWHDLTARSIEWFGQLSQMSTTGLTLAGVLGPDILIGAGNLGRNLKSGALRIVMGLCSASGI